MCIKVGTPEWRQYMVEQVNVPVEMLTYLENGFQFEFEEAEKNNDKEWFSENFCDHNEFMEYHSKNTYPIFKWNNYTNFKQSCYKCFWYDEDTREEYISKENCNKEMQQKIDTMDVNELQDQITYQWDCYYKDYKNEHIKSKILEARCIYQVFAVKSFDYGLYGRCKYWLKKFWHY